MKETKETVNCINCQNALLFALPIQVTSQNYGYAKQYYAVASKFICCGRTGKSMSIKEDSVHSCFVYKPHPNLYKDQIETLKQRIEEYEILVQELSDRMKGDSNETETKITE